jgi:hypothetical protein
LSSSRFICSTDSSIVFTEAAALADRLAALAILPGVTRLSIGFGLDESALFQRGVNGGGTKQGCKQGAGQDLHGSPSAKR